MRKLRHTQQLICILALSLTVSQATAKVLRGGVTAGIARLSGSGAKLNAIVGEPIVGRTNGNGMFLGAGSLGLWIEPSSTPTAVEGEANAPRRFELPPSSPNPFNPRTTVRYIVPGGGQRVRLAVFDLRGRLVRTLIDAPLPAGAGSIVWDGVDDGGRSVASGTYLIQLLAGRETAVQKVTLVK